MLLEVIKLKKKKWLSLLLTVIMVLSLVPMTVFAAGTVTVQIGGTTLNDGANSIGGGTATLDKAAGTLTLENVSVTNYIDIQSDSEFTIIAKGNNAIGSVDSRTNGTAMFSTNVPTLNVQIQEGATLSLYTTNGNNIYLVAGALNISGPGKFVADTTGSYPAICANKNVTFQGNLDADITSEQTGVYSEKGNIAVESADLTVDAQAVGLFAQTYDAVTDDSLPSSITLRNSVLNITAAGDSAVFCGTGGIIVENTKLTATNSNDDPDYGGYSLYSEGNILITGAQTDVTTDDGVGISADDVLTIEGGKVTASSSSTTLLGWNGVTISGGTVNVTADTGSAILARDGAMSITGENTTVVATSNDADVATIRNFSDGGIHLDASVTANNTAEGGKPFEGVKKDKSVAITLGTGYEVFGAQVYTTATGHSYFIPLNGDGSKPLTGKAALCKHTWGTPVWNWAEDYSKATVTFTCTKDASHTKTVEATVTSTTTDATCAKDGQTAYRASVTFDGTDYSDEKTVAIQATGKHTYVDGKCTVCGAADPDYQPDDTTDDTSKPDDDVPQTGDNSSMTFLWISLMALAAAGLTGTVLYSRKRKEN